MVLPATIVDAANSVRDGEFGLIEEIKIGDLVVSALTALDATDEMEITEKPVEAGYTVTDAAIKLPARRSIDIVLASPDYSIEAGIDAALTGSVDQLVNTWRDKKKRLYEYFENKELVTLQTHQDIIESMMIQSITPIYDVENNFDAFFATVVLQEVRVVGSGEIDDSNDNLKKAAPKSDRGNLN